MEPFDSTLYDTIANPNNTWVQVQRLFPEHLRWLNVPHPQRNRQTPIFAAIIQTSRSSVRSREIIKGLLRVWKKAGKDPEHLLIDQNHTLVTPLLLACKSFSSDHQILSILVKYAPVAIFMYELNGTLPIHIVSNPFKIDILVRAGKEFLQRNSNASKQDIPSQDVPCRDPSGECPCDRSISLARQVIDIADGKGRTPFHRAAKDQRIEQLTALLRHGGQSYRQLDQNGLASIHYVAQGNIHVDTLRHQRFIKHLVRADPTILDARTSQNETPLHIAAARSQVGIVRSLLQHKWNQTHDLESYLKIKDAGGRTALIRALNHNHRLSREMIEILIFEGYLRDRCPSPTPLHAPLPSPQEKELSDDKPEDESTEEVLLLPLPLPRWMVKVCLRLIRTSAWMKLHQLLEYTSLTIEHPIIAGIPTQRQRSPDYKGKFLSWHYFESSLTARLLQAIEIV